jgi:hypothetical protein
MPIAFKPPIWQHLFGSNQDQAFIAWEWIVPLKKTGICLAAFVFAICPAMADVLDGPAIRKLVTGRTIFLAAPLGGEFPLNYKRDGTVNGDGTSVGLGPQRKLETGRWKEIFFASSSPRGTKARKSASPWKGSRMAASAGSRPMATRASRGLVTSAKTYH